MSLITCHPRHDHLVDDCRLVTDPRGWRSRGRAGHQPPPPPGHRGHDHDDDDGRPRPPGPPWSPGSPPVSRVST